MYESYGKELLASGTFDGKLFALPETAIDDGSQLLWLRRDWMEQLGVKEPKTLDEALSVIRAFQENRMGAEEGEDPVGLVCDPGLVGVRSVPVIRWTLCLKCSVRIPSSGSKMQMEKLSMDH